MYLHIYPFKSKSLVCDHKQARKYTHTHMRNPVMLVWDHSGSPQLFQALSHLIGKLGIQYLKMCEP